MKSQFAVVDNRFFRRPARSFSKRSLIAALAALAPLVGCGSPPPLVGGPVSVRPVARPGDLERTVTGGIYRADSSSVALFSDQRKPSRIGDTIKIDISESLAASNKVTADNSRVNSVTSIGPGAKNLTGALGSLADMNASASGSDSFTGKGDSSNTSQFTGRMTAYVINVLSNGNLQVAGERSVAFNTGVTTMRFSGVVNPLDIKAGGIVASGDVADARLELVGRGGAADSQGMNWLQKLLTGNLGVW